MLRSLTEFPRPAQQVSVLTKSQIYHYLEEGYVKVSGLISPEIAARADEAAWRKVGISPDDPSTWPKAPHSTFCTDPELMAMYTPQLLTAVGQLVSENPHKFPASGIPHNAYIITTTVTSEPWAATGEHIDGLGDWNCIFESFPAQWKMFAMIYLHDVPSHSGCTLVYPRSHRKAQALLRSTPEKYRFLASLADDFKTLDIGEPLEVPVSAGDVVFLDQLMTHAGSKNTGKRPRFALNMKW